MSEKPHFLRERKCDICGKEFILTEDWIYRRGSRTNDFIFCSWKCMRAFDSKQKSKAERRDAIKKALMDGLTVNEIVKTLGEDRSLVLYWKKKLIQNSGWME